MTTHNNIMWTSLIYFYLSVKFGTASQINGLLDLSYCTKSGCFSFGIPNTWS